MARPRTRAWKSKTREICPLVDTRHRLFSAVARYCPLNVTATASACPRMAAVLIGVNSPVEGSTSPSTLLLLARLPSTTLVPSERTATSKTSSPDADRKSTRLNSSHVEISYAVFCLKKKKKQEQI